MRPERLGWTRGRSSRAARTGSTASAPRSAGRTTSQADIALAWKRILGTVRTYADLEPTLLASVEELIDFVTGSGEHPDRTLNSASHDWNNGSEPTASQLDVTTIRPGENMSTNQPYGPTSGQAPATGEERTASILAHLSAIIARDHHGRVAQLRRPAGHLGIYKDRSPLVRQAAAGSFNFNVGLWIMNIVAWICVFTVVLIPVALVLFFIANVLHLRLPHHRGGQGEQGRGLRLPVPDPHPALTFAH